MRIMKDLNFALGGGGSYESDAFQVQSDFGLHLEFSEYGQVQLRQSMTGEGYETCLFISRSQEVVDRAVTGVIAGMWFKVVCEFKPRAAKVLGGE